MLPYCSVRSGLCTGLEPCGGQILESKQSNPVTCMLRYRADVTSYVLEIVARYDNEVEMKQLRSR